MTRKQRRGPGDGSIIQLPDGTWRGAIRLGPDPRTGKARRRWVRGKTRGDVQRQLVRLQKASHDGLPVAVCKTTVAAWVRWWLDNVVKGTVRASTFTRYEDIARVHIGPGPIGGVPLTKLRRDMVQSWITGLAASGLRPATVSRILQVLRASMTHAERDGLVAVNPARLVRLPRGERFTGKPLTPEQTRTFLDAISGDRHEALYLVLLACGLRRGEGLGLRWGDVDLEARSVSIEGAIQRQRGAGLVRVECKTDRSRRVLALPELVVNALRAHRRRQLEDRLLAGPVWQDTGYVFTSSFGTPLDGANVLKEFRRVLAVSGLPTETRLHDLRHGCATLLLASGVSPRVVMEQLGHSQITLTMNTYAHVMPAALRDAAKVMDETLSGGRS
jgi:integrase